MYPPTVDPCRICRGPVLSSYRSYRSVGYPVSRSYRSYRSVGYRYRIRTEPYHTGVLDRVLKPYRTLNRGLSAEYLLRKYSRYPLVRTLPQPLLEKLYRYQVPGVFVEGIQRALSFAQRCVRFFCRARYFSPNRKGGNTEQRRFQKCPVSRERTFRKTPCPTFCNTPLPWFGEKTSAEERSHPNAKSALFAITDVFYYFFDIVVMHASSHKLVRQSDTKTQNSANLPRPTLGVTVAPGGQLPK